MAKAKKTLQPGEAELKNPKHELFCTLYAGLASKRYFGNATQCYLHVYGGEERVMDLEEEIEETWTIDTTENKNRRRSLKNEQKRIEHVANVEGCKLLVKPGIAQRTDWLLDQFLTDAKADREMAYVMTQRDDMMSKVAAYREIAKVKERIRGAGALQGEFTFAWEGDEEEPKAGGKKKPTVKARMTMQPQEEPVAEFAS